MTMSTGSLNIADRSSHEPRAVHRIKSLIWIYFWLLIFEGSVRKWIPPLSTPFLLVRDPVAVVIWFQALRFNLLDKRYWGLFYLFAFGLTLLGLLQVLAVSLPLPVFLYGWRSYILHVPVFIVAANILNVDDLKKIGRWLLLLSLPMTLLMFAQYNAPSVGWLNRGAYEGGTQIGSALGHVRPAGTFSFITGAASFEQLTAAFVLLGLTKRGLYPRWLVISAALALVAVLPISGSRTLVIGVGAVVAAAFFGTLVRGAISFHITQIPKILASILVACFLMVGLSQISLIQDGMRTFMVRWNQTAEGEGGGSGTAAVKGRVLGPFIFVLDTAANAPPLGKGIGLGSNFGGVYTGVGGLALGESPWDREVNELGSFIGLLFLALRVVLGVSLAVMAYRALRRGTVLPFYLLPAAVQLVLIGALDQPTAQGFLVVVSALSWAALKGDPAPSAG
jgi:hypothetical protein